MTAAERADGSSDAVARAAAFVHGPALPDALRALASREPDRVYLKDAGAPVTAAELLRRVQHMADQLRARGVTADSRVALSLPVGADHVVSIFALLELGALWIPLNTQLIGAPLAHQLEDSGATHIVADPAAALTQDPVVRDAGSVADFPGALSQQVCFVVLAGAHRLQQEPDERAGACLLMYTSGTTGPPKGALVTEAMLRAAVLGALEVSAPIAGDVFFVWEPLFHIGGAQVVFLPLFAEVSLALVPRFSASRFWNDVQAYDATHIHYLGGVLQILLQLPVDPAERDNRVRVAWGAGATPEVQTACRERYSFALHECYGMTEASSIITVNADDQEGGVGVPLPWVEVAIRPHAGTSQTSTAPGSVGEIVVRGRIGGIVTPGYLGNAEASAKIRDGEWFCTGDLGSLDAAGRLHFRGRASDSIRVRGENISAWQIESVFGLHPAIDRCAVIGVDAAVGEQEMVLCYTVDAGASATPQEILEWGAARLAKFQVPRYARRVEAMPLTPSQRVAKHKLSHTLEGATDRAR
ncbi:class I adenylate-forming enzyme family protein [Leucobacter komagatae]|uniref:class I adenylate-forming enzyme family protein n=1 Tax=Leucobacter komagatae TaxID=55969 RepID=UPI0006982C66|nr:AMP-binding protein [Leucobacter komagatae]